MIYTSKANIKRNEDEFLLEQILLKVTDNVEVIKKISTAAALKAEKESPNYQSAENQKLAPEEYKLLEISMEKQGTVYANN